VDRQQVRPILTVAGALQVPVRHRPVGRQGAHRDRPDREPALQVDDRPVFGPLVAIERASGSVSETC
jgi:hypothetical protein